MAGYAGSPSWSGTRRSDRCFRLLRHGPSREAIDSSFTDDLERIEREPGVRANL
ncbi:MAG TPA: hypothetical protein VG265_07625 [Gaiellaceae bacterium]|nr:hypothetical protein [Gaiellaceae bacterium]